MPTESLRLTLPCPADRLDAFLSAPSAAVIASVVHWTGKVLVLGAGGKMGLHLCMMLKTALSLAGSQAEVVAVSRFTTLRDRSAFDDEGIKTLACDLADPAQLGALPEAEIVFFLAGQKFGTAAAPDLLRTMNVLVPRGVVERYRSSRMVAFSTGCVYPFVPTSSRGADENTPPGPVGDYAQSCLGRELEFARGSLRHGTPVVLIRLNYAVEFRYGVLVDIATRVRDGRAVDVTMGHVNLIWQRDAVDQIIRAHPLAASPAVALNITGADVLSVRQIAADFERLFEKPSHVCGTEAPTAWLNDASKAHRLLGRPPTSLETMENWVAAWLLADGGTWGKPTGFERRDGRF